MDDAPAPPPRFEPSLRAMELIVSGLFLKVVIAEGMRLWLIGLNASWPTERLADSAVIVLYVYFDFWGYSLVARGTGLLLSVPTPVNFRAPLLSTSVTEFWTRWHMSLGAFVRKNIFTPVQVALVRHFGVKRAYYTNLVALCLSFGFVGLWHRLSGLFLLWGLSMGLVMAAEKLILNQRMLQWRREHPWVPAVMRIVGPVYVFIVIVTTLHLVMPELIGARR
jgi:D-alanyl-lipoteichoic acid acyltransferase DltB (MBOAT superfamily)